MKKFILCVLVGALAIAGLFAQEWTISTSQGDKTLVIPEGLSLEEAYCQMAQLYWEERYDREDLQDSVQVLTEQVSSYIEANKELQKEKDSLILSYSELSSLYEEKTRTPWFRGLLSADFGWSFYDNQMTGAIYGGVLIKERVTLEAGIRYPWSVSLKAGVII